MTHIIDDFLSEYYPYSKSTKKTYRIILERFLETGPAHRCMTASDFCNWLDKLENWGGSMRWLAFSAVKSFLRWKYGDDHQALKLKYRREKTPPQPTLSTYQTVKLLNYFDLSTRKGIRDLAIFALFIDTGIREKELCGLILNRLDIKNQIIAVEIKGGDWEYGIFSYYTGEYLRAWLSIRSEIAKPGIQNVFVGIGGKKPGTPTTEGGLRAIVRKWGDDVGIEHLSPHDFRRTFTTLATLARSPTRITQIAGRWKRITEVERYTRALQLEAFRPFLPVKYVKSLGEIDS